MFDRKLSPRRSHQHAPISTTTGKRTDRRKGRQQRQPTVLCVVQSWRLGLLVVIVLTVANHFAGTLHLQEGGAAVDMSTTVVVTKKVAAKAKEAGNSTEEPRRDVEREVAAAPAADVKGNGNSTEGSERAAAGPKNSTEPRRQHAAEQKAVTAAARAPAAGGGSTLPFRIIQVSRHHTGSTMMANLLTGLVQPEANTCYLGMDVRLIPEKPDPCPGNHVVKTHKMDIFRLIWWFREHFAADRVSRGSVLVVSTSRGNVTIGEEYCGDGRYGRNVLCFEYDDVLYSDEVGMREVVHRVASTLRSTFPRVFADESLLDEEAAVGRLREMDRVQREMADRPFEEQNEKFLIHGGHRNRKNDHRK